MPNQITLCAEPFAPAPSSSGRATDITATVTDSGGEPVEGAVVNFSAGDPHACFTASAGTTDDRGQTTVTLTYPSPDVFGQAGVGVIPVTAAVNDDSKTVLINFYDPRLRPVKILNTERDEKTGLTKVGNIAIAFGVQALVYLPDTLADGDKATFYWGEYIAKKTCAKGEHVWVVEPGKLFIPEQALKQGNYRVWYSIENSAGHVIGALPLDAVITHGPHPVLMN